MAHISKYAKSVARMLLKLKAVTLNVAEPYTWSSGLRSPIYCDNRLIISDVATRNKIKEYLAKVIREEFGMPLMELRSLDFTLLQLILLRSFLF